MSAAPYAELNLGGAVGDDPAAVLANRERAARGRGLDPARVVWMNQVHGRDVAVVDGPWGDASEIPAVDAVVTARRGLPLAVLTADCTPVLLADPVAGIVAAAHAGRPGLVAGVVPAAVGAMVRLGADPSRMIARTGPAVCGRCYEVPAAMRDEVAKSVPASWSETSWGTPPWMSPPGSMPSSTPSESPTGTCRPFALSNRVTISRTDATAPPGGSPDMSGWTDRA